MDPAANQRVSANRVVLILALLLGVWLAFQFYPRRKEPPPPLPPVAAESKLRAAGLADNPDWEALPEFFAVWADKIEWDNDKTQFAYWNPGSSTYSYYFETSRANGHYRFRALSRQEIAAIEDLVVESKESDTPPFVFRRARHAETSTPVAGQPGIKLITPQPPSVKVELAPAPLPVPPPPPITPP
jgi:hypothetical protein